MCLVGVFANPLSIKPSTDMEPNRNFLCIRSWAGIKVCFLPFSTDWVMILHQAHLGALFRKGSAFLGMLLAPALHYYCFICVKIQHVWARDSVSPPLCDGAWTCLQETFLAFLTESFGANTLWVGKPLSLCAPKPLQSVCHGICPANGMGSKSLYEHWQDFWA